MGCCRHSPLPKPGSGILPGQTHEDFFSQTWESKVCFFVRDSAFPHHQLWQAACISKSLESIFPSPRASGLDCGGSCISAEWRDVQPTLKALLTNAVLLGMPLTQQHHFHTSKLSYLGDTGYTLNGVYFLCIQSSQKLGRSKSASEWVILCYLVSLKCVTAAVFGEDEGRAKL